MVEDKRILDYEVKQSSINKAKQELEKLKKKELELAKSIALSDDASIDQLKALKKVQAAQRDQINVLKVLESSFGKQENAVNEATSALDAYEDRLRKVQQGGADLSGDLASSFGGLRGAGDALTGGNFGAAGKGFEVAEAFADLGEFVPRLKAQAETFGDALRGVDGNLGKTVSSITGLSSGTSAFLTVAVPAAVILGGLAIGYAVLQKAQEKQIEAIKQEADARERAVDFLIQGASTDEVATRLEEIAREREIIESQLVSDSQQNYDEYLSGTRGLTQQTVGLFAETSNQFLGSFNPLSQTLNTANEVVQNFGGTVDFAIQQVDGAEQAYFEVAKEHQQRLDDLSAEEAQLVELRNEGVFSANDMAQAEEKLAEKREELEEKAKQALARAGQLQTQYNDIVESTAIANTNAAELESAQAQIDRENAAIAEQKHQESLANIREQGNARIAQIDTELSALPQERLSALAKVQGEGNQKLADLQKEYQQSTIEKYQDFQKDMERSTSDAAKSIARLARDIRQSLTDATLENDVAAFLKAQRDGETRLKDTREDAQEQQKRAIEDFVAGREKERAAYEAKQATIQQAIRDEQMQVMQAYADRRQALLQQRIDEAKATEERLAQERARHQEQLDNDARRAEQQGRLDEIRERQQLEAHNRRLQEIQSESMAQTNAYNLAIQKANALAVAAASIRVPVGGQAGGGQDPVSPFSSNRGGSTNFFTQARTSITNNTTVGDVASMGDVEKAVNKGVNTALGEINKTVQSARNGRNSYA